MKKLKIVGVMGSGVKAWAGLTESLGREIAARPVHLLTGGGDGVMRTVSRGFTDVATREGLALGCIPMSADDEGNFHAHARYPNPYIEVPIYTPLGVYKAEDPDAVTRNHINVLTSDLIIALPGMGGTRNEIGLAVKFNKALVLYGPEEEFADLPATLPRADTLADAMIWLDGQLDFK